MSFAIGKNGIASIDFTVSLDKNETNIRMTRPYECTEEFHEEQIQFGKIFDADYYSDNSVEIVHGRYSEKTLVQLKISVDILKERSIIDLQRHYEIMKRLEEMVAQVKIECERETTQFASFLADFKANVEKPYRDLTKSIDFMVKADRSIMTYGTIGDLGHLIDEVSDYRGNPMKIGSRWLFLFLCEGDLENLIRSLNTRELNGPKGCSLVVLAFGVMCFLKQHESELHKVIEKTIDATTWFQEVYTKYKSMVETGKSSREAPYYLILPSRFAK